MSDQSRRNLLKNLSLTALAAGLSTVDAQHVHQMATDEKKASGAYKAKAFTDHEYATLRKMNDIIFPGSLEGGTSEFIDLLCSHSVELSAIFTGGFAWVDDQMMKRYQASFIDSKPGQQTEFFDLIAYRKNGAGELGPGVRFFEWIRKMTSDGYYTGKIGIADLGFMGNKGMAKFEIPAEAIQYALKRSPV